MVRHTAAFARQDRQTFVASVNVERPCACTAAFWVAHWGRWSLLARRRISVGRMARAGSGRPTRLARAPLHHLEISFGVLQIREISGI